MYHAKEFSDEWICCLVHIEGMVGKFGAGWPAFQVMPNKRACGIALASQNGQGRGSRGQDLFAATRTVPEEPLASVWFGLGRVEHRLAEC